MEATRSSKRICQRQNRTFKRPSREEQWNAIPAEDPSSACIARLKPRKLVNDFTKITHRYNYDPAETSGDESVEDFINDSSSSASDSEDNTEPTQKGHRIKGYRSRITTVESDSSGEDKPDHAVLPKRCRASDVDEKALPQKEQLETASAGLGVCCSTDDIDSEEILSPSRGNKNLTVLDSDSDSEKQIGLEPTGGQAQEDSQNSSSDSDYDSSGGGRFQKLADKRKKARDTMFSKLREARLKRLKT